MHPFERQEGCLKVSDSIGVAADVEEENTPVELHVFNGKDVLVVVV